MNSNVISGIEDLKITIVSHTSKSDREWSSLCIQSQREYAEKHGIDYYLHEEVNTLGRDPRWSRFRVIQGRVAGGSLGDVVVWMDSDLLVMNPNFNLRDLVSQFAGDPAAICHFPVGGVLDLGLLLVKAHSSLNDMFEIGWDAGAVEAQGPRRDKLSFELMNFLLPKNFRSASCENILSNWYPPSPYRFFSQQIDSSEGAFGAFWMKKPNEMINGYPDLYLPGCFAVHLHQKGSRLLETSKEFLEYRNSLSEGIEEAQKMAMDIRGI